VKNKLCAIENFRRRLLMCLSGGVVCGIAAGMMLRASLGVDVFTAFVTGLNRIIPLSYGTLYLIVCLLILVFVLIADWHKIGIGTLLNMLLVGYIVDGTQRILYLWFPDLGIAGRIVLLILGILILCFSLSVYFTADLGVPPYDAIALIITGTWHKGQFRVVRVVGDVSCVVAAVILLLISGAGLGEILSVVGIGTIVAACFLGPVIDWFNRKFSEPFLHRTLKRKN